MQEKKTRLTHQKLVIMDMLKQNKNTHFSADELSQKLKDKGLNVGLATVYRNLKRFEEDNMVIRIVTGDESAVRYQYASDGQHSVVHSHHHLICTQCNKIEDFDVDLLDSVEKLIANKKDFIITNHQLLFYGICSNCKNKNK